MIRLILISFFVLMLAVTSLAGAPVQPDLIRVALLKGVDSVAIGGNGILAVNEAGEPLKMGHSLFIKKGPTGFSVNGQTVSTLRVSASGQIQVNGKGYRGIIEISAVENGILVIDELPVEDYLIGLINCEISSQWPIEVIKAQAVIARSYALYQLEARKNAPYHLDSTVIDQVYDGCDIEDSRAARGVRETAGEVLKFNGKVIQAFYHSNCGGHTEAAENVWGYSLPYLQGVECKYCLSSGAGRWDLTIPLKKIESLLRGSGFQVGAIKDTKAGRRNISGRVVELTIFSTKGTLLIPGASFRKAVGYSAIKSTNLEVKIVGTEVVFSGSGYGHGVGLCQWGAKQRGEEGFNYREILSYYYPGTELGKMYSGQ